MFGVRVTSIVLLPSVSEEYLMVYFLSYSLELIENQLLRKYCFHKAHKSLLGQLYDGYDEEYDCPILDEDRVSAISYKVYIFF